MPSVSHWTSFCAHATLSAHQSTEEDGPVVTCPFLKFKSRIFVIVIVQGNSKTDTRLFSSSHGQFFSSLLLCLIAFVLISSARRANVPLATQLHRLPHHPTTLPTCQFSWLLKHRPRSIQRTFTLRMREARRPISQATRAREILQRQKTRMTSSMLGLRKKRPP